jgi:hypothetical protein
VYWDSGRRSCSSLRVTEVGPSSSWVAAALEVSSPPTVRCSRHQAPSMLIHGALPWAPKHNRLNIQLCSGKHEQVKKHSARSSRANIDGPDSRPWTIKLGTSVRWWAWAPASGKRSQRATTVALGGERQGRPAQAGFPLQDPVYPTVANRGTDARRR